MNFNEANNIKSVRKSLTMIKEYFFLWKNIYRSRDQLLDLQRKRITSMVRQAYTNSTYYRNIFDDIDFHPDDLIRDFNSFQLIPILSKEELRKIDISDIISRKYKNIDTLINYPTSGSTGVPYYIYKSKKDSTKNDLAHIRSFLYNKWGTFSKIVSIVGDIEVREPSIFQRLGILPIKYISINQPISDIVRKVQKLDFDILKGYTDDIRLMAKYIIDNKIKNIRPKIVSTTAALLDDITKKLIVEAFEVEPMDSYGAADAGQIAWHCSERNYHINIDMVYVEIIKEGKPVKMGDSGEIVITVLWNKAFPLIRFKLGDIVSLKEGICKCGCEFPLLNMIDGKTIDFIVLPNGNIVPPHSPKQVMIDVTQVDGFKIIQDTISNVIVQIVPNKYYNNDVKEKIIKNMSLVFNNDIDVRVEEVKQIPRGIRKFSTIESKIGQDYLMGKNIS